MKFNFSGANVINYPVRAPLMDGDKPVEIKNLCILAMMQGNPQEQIPVELKVKKYKLGMLLCNMVDDQIELSAEEVAMIKQGVGSLWGPMIVGQIHEFLENPNSSMVQ